MRTFTIDHDSRITAFASEKEVKAINGTSAQAFATQENLTKLADGWPGRRLVEIWNRLPGTISVNKFTDRKTAVARIWKALQKLDPGAKAGAGGNGTPAKGGLTSRHANSKEKDDSARHCCSVRAAREGTKKAAILRLLQQEKGATMQELMSATKWQAHSIRGLISGTLTKKMRLQVGSSKRPDGERVYQLTRMQPDCTK